MFTATLASQGPTPVGDRFFKVPELSKVADGRYAHKCWRQFGSFDNELRGSMTSFDVHYSTLSPERLRLNCVEFPWLEFTPGKVCLTVDRFDKFDFQSALSRKYFLLRDWTEPVVMLVWQSFKGFENDHLICSAGLKHVIVRYPFCSNVPVSEREMCG